VIYLDNAATTPMPLAVSETLYNIYIQWGYDLGNAGGVYKNAKNSAFFLEKLRNEFREIFNIPENYIILFTSGASESNSTVFASHDGPLFCSNFEHPSVNSYPEMKAIDLALIEETLAECASKGQQPLLSVIYIQHETGIIMNIPKMREITRKYNARLHIDASQAKELDIKTLDADYITISSHKIGGPIGVGALISKTLLNPLIFGGAQEFNMRAGTQPLPLIGGFVEAAKYMKKHNFFKEHFMKLKSILKNEIDSKFFLETFVIEEMKFVDNVICMLSAQIPASEVAAFMDMNDIAISLGSACKSGSLDGIVAIKSLLKEGVIDESINPVNAFRISFGWNTKEQDVEIFAKKFNAFIQKRIKI